MSVVGRGWFALLAAALGLLGVQGAAQMETETTQTTSACTLAKGVYTCDSVRFAKTLNEAKSVAIETHSVDKFAQAQLKDLLAKKLGKTIVSDGSPADLIFILVPLSAAGVDFGRSDNVLGTLQVYQATPEGRRGGLVWVETYSGSQDLPWPAVVNSLTGQFQKRFNVK